MLTSLMALLQGEGDALIIFTNLFALMFVTLCCLPVHESAHAFIADKLGDPTGKLSGRINLNPMAHLSLVGTLMMFFFGFGYAKPVPVNIRNFKKRKLYFALTSLAGPVSNLLLAVIFTVIRYIFVLIISISASDSMILYVSQLFFFYAAYINVMLAVFNLIPLPPLDGSRIFLMFLPDNIYYKILNVERYLMYALFLLLMLFNKLGFSPVGIAASAVFSFINNCVSAVFSLFM